MELVASLRGSKQRSSRFARPVWPHEGSRGSLSGEAHSLLNRLAASFWTMGHRIMVKRCEQSTHCGVPMETATTCQGGRPNLGPAREPSLSAGPTIGRSMASFCKARFLRLLGVKVARLRRSRKRC